MTELRLGNPDSSRFLEIREPNYGGIFIVGKRDKNVTDMISHVKRQIEKGCIPGGMMWAYVMGSDVDNISGRVMTSALIDKMEEHMEECRTCVFMVYMLTGSKAGLDKKKAYKV